MYKTEPEKIWAGKHGDEWVERSQGESILARNLSLFSKILSKTHDIKSVLEYGAGNGNNFLAIKRLLPGVELSGVEINQNAADLLEQNQFKTYRQSLFDFTVDYQRDLVLSKGILIHIVSEELPGVYDKLYQSTKRYILICEYYNPTPVMVNYRGHTNLLFKRDFAGEMLDRYDELSLVDYGFVYHRDCNFPQDDTNWFLLEKK